MIQGFFGGFVGSARNFWGGWIFASALFNYLHHLKSGVPPGDFLGLLFHADLHFVVVKRILGATLQKSFSLSGPFTVRPLKLTSLSVL